MQKGFWNYTNYLISGFVLIVLGIIIMIGSLNLYTSIVNLLVFAFLLLGIFGLCNLLKSPKELSKEKIVRVMINIVFGVIMNVFKDIPLSIVPILFAFYLLFNSLVKGISAYFLWRNKEHKWKEISLFIFFFITGIMFLFSPLGHLPTILSIIGLYCALIGLGEWKKFLLERIPYQTKKWKRSIYISLPAFLDAFIPRRMLTKINHYFNDIKEEVVFEIKKETTTPDLEIFIHVAPHGFNQLGHMDIYFDGKVISYGNYDKTSYRMFDSIGDGVLFETKKEKYIPFCIKQSNKTLIGFGMKLTEKQKEKVRKEINHIKQNTYLWETTASIEQKEAKERKPKYEYIDLLCLETGATTYKFKTGEFKTYFVLGRNCTLFADRIVGKSGTDILKMVGIISPGTYLDYLENEFSKKNSMVISRTIYNEHTKEKVFHENKSK